MRVLLHDYAGHAFTAQLARALASRGLEVLYVSFGGFESPKGRVERLDSDPFGFRARQLTLDRPIDKENLVRRWIQQHDYARAIAALVREEKPDVVLSSAPVEVQDAMIAACRSIGASFVFWVQDIHAEAIARILGKKLPLVGKLAGSYYRWKEAGTLSNSDGVVVIAEAFLDVFGSARWGLDVSDMKVIENWANIADVPVLPRDNDWTQDNMRAGRRRVVYSGTLARKHNPDLLLDLARNLDADIHLFSRGAGADYVREAASSEGLDNMIVRSWVSVEDLPSMLAGADILFAVIEADAGVFSVPSKVLSYLAAGKPILASIPTNNLAAINVTREGAGLIAAPGDTATLVANAKRLLEAPAERQAMGAAGRAYAEKAFDIEVIAGKFETILREARGALRQ